MSGKETFVQHAFVTMQKIHFDAIGRILIEILYDLKGPEAAEAYLKELQKQYPNK